MNYHIKCSKCSLSADTRACSQSLAVDFKTALSVAFAVKANQILKCILNWGTVLDSVAAGDKTLALLSNLIIQLTEVG